ncbi:hypothetical protein BDV96DRAFT_596157 [Lophiotrema nucula]|uniref:Uncharacterized protein n=1 Tax=Lophiotrema nucula TaxID=690887 RepID=A0A6A5ZIS5_9PLEO|nr:hypothetical protein BDV96DRAFT_596157 [Lophiotrema nucula]
MAPSHDQTKDAKQATGTGKMTHQSKYSWRNPPNRNAKHPPQNIFSMARPDSGNSTEASFMTAKTHLSTSEPADSTAPAASSTHSSLLPTPATLQSEPEIFDPYPCELEQNCTILQTSKGDLVWPGRLTNVQLAIAQARIAELEAEEEGRKLEGFDIEESMRRTKAEREEEYRREDARELLERQRRRLEREVDQVLKDE